MQTYARQGGTSTILVHNYGLQLISEKERAARIAFYADNNIGWVARPPHSSAPYGYKRAGRFKKASNMNFALNFSSRVERRMQEMMDARVETTGSDLIDEAEEEEMYNSALAQLLDEEPLAWAEGDVRVGEIILIVDSDTIVPEVCSSLTSSSWIAVLTVPPGLLP